LPVGSIVHQLKSTMCRAIGDCGFRTICLTEICCIRWEARFCRRFRVVRITALQSARIARMRWGITTISKT
jgi:hypothetical protein